MQTRNFQCFHFPGVDFAQRLLSTAADAADVTAARPGFDVEVVDVELDMGAYGASAGCQSCPAGGLGT